MSKRESKSSGPILKWVAAVVLAVVFVGPALAQEEPLPVEVLFPDEEPQILLEETQITGTIFLSDSGWRDEHGNDPGVGTWDSDTLTGTLITDVYETIQIDSDGITLDGNGHTVTVSGKTYGVYLSDRYDVTIKNLDMQECYVGIQLIRSSNNILTDNTMSYCVNGMILYQSSNNNLTGNTTDLNNNGIFLSKSSSNTLTDNVANSNKYDGILLSKLCNNNRLTGSTVSYNYRGICLKDSSDNTLTDNIVKSNEELGILLDGSNNTLIGNTISNNYYGIFIQYYSNGNEIYNNNFIDNMSLQVLARSAGNVYNLAAPTGGNYWSDWTSPDEDGDGFVDRPYAIGEFLTEKDSLPWVVQDGWDPLVQIEQLIAKVIDLNLHQGIDNSLDAKLDAAFKAIDDVNENNDVAATNTLQAFINAVEAQRGNKIPEVDADALIAAAQQIINMLMAG